MKTRRLFPPTPGTPFLRPRLDGLPKSCSPGNGSVGCITYTFAFFLSRLEKKMFLKVFYNPFCFLTARVDQRRFLPPPPNKIWGALLLQLVLQKKKKRGDPTLTSTYLSLSKTEEQSFDTEFQSSLERKLANYDTPCRLNLDLRKRVLVLERC